MMQQLICPKCQEQYKLIDNFCEECGKDLNIIKLKDSKTEKRYGNQFL